MDISRNTKLHRFGKNELGDQLHHKYFKMYDRLKGIEVALKLFAEGFEQADGSGETIDQYDLACMNHFMAWNTQRLSEDMAQFQEILFANSKFDFLEIFNRYDAETDSFSR